MFSLSIQIFIYLYRSLPRNNIELYQWSLSLNTFLHYHSSLQYDGLSKLKNYQYSRIWITFRQQSFYHTRWGHSIQLQYNRGHTIYWRGEWEQAGATHTRRGHSISGRTMVKRYLRQARMGSIACLLDWYLFRTARSHLIRCWKTIQYALFVAYYYFLKI